MFVRVIRRVVGVVHAVALNGAVPGNCLAIVFDGNAEPLGSVVRRDDAVVLPRFRRPAITTRVLNDEPAVLILCSGQREVEPDVVLEFPCLFLADVQTDRLRIAGIDDLALP